MKTDKTNQNKVTKFNIFSAWTWSNMAATDNTSFFWCCKKNNSHLNLSRRRKNGGVIKVITFCLVSTDQAQSKQWSLNNDKRDLKKKGIINKRSSHRRWWQPYEELCSDWRSALPFMSLRHSGSQLQMGFVTPSCHSLQWPAEEDNHLSTLQCVSWRGYSKLITSAPPPPGWRHRKAVDKVKRGLRCRPGRGPKVKASRAVQ